MEWGVLTCVGGGFGVKDVWRKKRGDDGGAVVSEGKRRWSG